MIKLMELLSKNHKNEFGCIMLKVKFDLISQMHKFISKDDLYEADGYGLETEPHITLIYGLTDDNIDIKKLINSLQYCVWSPVKINNVSCFENDEFDVLKFEVENKTTFEKANKILNKLPCSPSEFDYHPHMTIAYLKPGKGNKYVEKFKEAEYTVLPMNYIFSKMDGTQKKIACYREKLKPFGDNKSYPKKTK